MEKPSGSRLGRFFFLWILVTILGTQTGFLLAMGQESIIWVGIYVLFCVPLMLPGFYLYNKALESDQKNNISLFPLRNIFLPWPKAATWLSLLVLLELVIVTPLYAYIFYPCSGLDAIRKLDGCVAIFSRNDHAVRNVVFSRDGKVFATSEIRLPVQIWSYPAMALISTLGEQWSFGTEMSLSSNGERIVICDHKAPISIAETKTGRVLHTLVQKNEGICDVVFTPDDRSVISISKSGLQTWDAATGRLINSVAQDDLQYLEVSPDGRLMATGNMLGEINIWRVADGTISATMKQRYLQSMAISFDGNYLMTAGWDIESLGVPSGEGNSSINIWNIKNGEIEKTITLQGFEIGPIAISRIGNGFAVGEQSCFGKSRSPFGKSCAYFWQTMTDEVPMNLRVPDGVRSIAFSPLDEKILLGTFDGIYIWQKP